MCEREGEGEKNQIYPWRLSTKSTQVYFSSPKEKGPLRWFHGLQLLVVVVVVVVVFFGDKGGGGVIVPTGWLV